MDATKFVWNSTSSASLSPSATSPLTTSALTIEQAEVCNINYATVEVLQKVIDKAATKEQENRLSEIARKLLKDQCNYTPKQVETLCYWSADCSKRIL